LVTPTRESETWTVGAEAWTSAPAGIVVGSMLPFRVSTRFLGTGGTLCYHSRSSADAVFELRRDRERPVGVPLRRRVCEGKWGREYED